MSDNLDTENNLQSAIQLRCLDPMEVLDFNGACEYLHCSRSFMFKMMTENKLPFKKVNGRLLFLKADVYNWLKDVENIKQCEEIGQDKLQNFL